MKHYDGHSNGNTLITFLFIDFLVNTIANAQSIGNYTFNYCGLRKKVEVGKYCLFESFIRNLLLLSAKAFEKNKKIG